MANDYVILTDSSCDLPAAMADELELTVVPLSVLTGGKSYVNYLDGREVTFSQYYSILRSGRSAATTAPNMEQFVNAMEPILQAGRDILYLGFSSSLSSTYHTGVMAAQELATRYPARKILTADTLSASMGQGLLLYLAVQEKRKGRSIEELKDWVEKIRLHLCHWFTVDDLQYLRKGGRVSAVSAALGTALNIKPVLHVDNEGRLIFIKKVHGRKQSLKYLADMMVKTGIQLKDQTIFISHGDCIEDVDYLVSCLRDRVRDVKINFVGPVIGAHAGPGVVALFFVGTVR